MRSFFILIISFLVTTVCAEPAKVRFLIGEAQVKASAQTADWKTLKLYDTVNDNDVVRTGANSLCEIELSDGSVVKLLDNSVMEIRNLEPEDEKGVDLFAGLGKFYFQVKKLLRKKFQVSTPVAVAAIRGTEFMIINDADESRLLVNEGKLDFSDVAGNYVLLLNGNQKSSLRSGQPPTEPEPLSNDEKEAFRRIRERSGKRIEEQPKEQPDRTPPPDKPVPAPDGGEEPEDDEKKTDSGIRTGVSIGAVTIDDELYNQIGLRPEFSIGKLGVALDLTIYIDKEGNIRKENWDSFRDVFEKIYYVRWGLRGDPFYIKVGAIDNYRLGFGILMNRYYNTIEYPNVIRTGMEVGFQAGKYGFDGMLNDFSELTNGGGVTAGRFSYKLLGKLELGASVAFDRNQYKGLKDRDNDGVPDYIDKFPDDKNRQVDTDNDGFSDADDYDRDGDGFTDNADLLIRNGLDPEEYINDDDYLADQDQWEKDNLDHPFNTDTVSNKTQLALALDISYPILNFDYLKLIAYSQYAKYPYNGAWGVTAPGLFAKFAFINAYAEYRVFGKRFIPEYFSSTYELERASFVTTSVNDSVKQIVPRTKRQSMQNITEQLKGYVIGADFNIFNYLIFGAEYQNMSRGSIRLRTLRSTLDLNTDFIPKINRAGAYYLQNNARDIFKRTEGTVLGYRLEYEISSGAALLLDYRQTFRDLNGDGKISGSDETIKTTNIQTVIRF